MTVSGNVSFFAQINSQVNRLSDLRATLDTLQRQATTQKKYDTYAGFGPDAQTIQRLHNDQKTVGSYLDNIDRITTRMTLQNNSMSEIIKTASDLLKSITMQFQGNTTNMQLVNQQARNGLDYIQNLLNQDIDGRYIFAGSDVLSKPFIDNTSLNSNFVTQISSWLSGAQTTPQFTTTVAAFSATALGLSPTLATDSSVTARVADNMDLDYTLKADEDPFQKVLNVFGLLANLQYPNPAVDVATDTDFEQVIQYASTTLGDAVTGLNAQSMTLASKFNLVNSLKDSHTSERNLLIIQIEKMEGTDQAEVITSMQALQTQLTASYQVTRMVSEMSLVNFM